MAALRTAPRSSVAGRTTTIATEPEPVAASNDR